MRLVPPRKFRGGPTPPKERLAKDVTEGELIMELDRVKRLEWPEAIVDETDRKLSRQLQRCLQIAKVKRSELYVSDATRKAITFHDLRATGITWCAVRGDDPLKIKQRGGHATFSTTEGYIREAENLRDGFGDVFPALPESLFGPMIGPSSTPTSRNHRGNGGGAGNRIRREIQRNTWGFALFAHLASSSRPSIA